jgi:hypothetical protein
MSEIFSATEIEELSAEIDRQLQELRQPGEFIDLGMSLSRRGL